MSLPEGFAGRTVLLAFAVLLVWLGGASDAWADGGGLPGAASGRWEPDQGLQNDRTREGAELGGLKYFSPLRLHLVRGGHIEGGMGGVDPDSQRVLLLQDAYTLAVDLDLIGAVTPLDPGVSPPVGEGALPMLKLAAASKAGALAKIPAHRVGAGLLSLLVPGLGQWVVGEDPRLGLALFVSDLFLIAGGLLSVFATPQASAGQRTVVAGLFFGTSIGVRIGAGVQGFVGSSPVGTP